MRSFRIGRVTKGDGRSKNPYGASVSGRDDRVDMEEVPQTAEADSLSQRFGMAEACTSQIPGVLSPGALAYSFLATSF
jgi:hypothetical protein